MRELALVGGAALTYGAVRAVTERSVTEARANARRILDLEQTLGIAWEHAAQRVVLPHVSLITFVNWVYIWGHWPVIIATAAWLYASHRATYVRLRNAMFVSGTIGFAFFALLPTLPPRLLDPSFVDTIREHSRAYRTLQPPSLTNQYAAMPSLHFGWNLLVGMALFSATRSRLLRALAVTIPVLMAFAVVATANHFVLDVFAGGALVLVAVGALALFDRIRTLDGENEPTGKSGGPAGSIHRRPRQRQQRGGSTARGRRVGVRRRG